ncbi:Helicase associated domain protein [Elizabethkingia anophelis]|uniref:Helicase associated domain protein n=1 Tax=Elizabethkingia anophelis TaxID=1117645 RepID=UPI002010679A|nr:Helicase associated domain protein [Elizabethkingia anophelis]MCL1034663.1 DEAD/DEAH box helicase family protein [Elizabethkingia anophelis]
MIQLFPHNKKAYENAKFILETENRVCIVHPTGTGKSLIIAKFIIENPKARCLFLSPNVFIFKEIKKHIQGNISNVDFQTYQYFLLNDIKLFIDYDYIFLDEFHRVGAPEWNKQIEDLLFFNPKAKIVGTTATHIRYLDDERNMAEELFRGNIASYMDLGTSVEKGIHKKPIYVSALYNIRAIIDDTQHKLQRNNRTKELERLKSRRIIWEESSGIDYIIKKYLTSERKKIIIFCKSIEHINYIEELVRPVLFEFYNGEVDFHTIHSALGKSKTSKIFSAFENGKIPQIMFAVDMVNEGIHIKGIDTVMMFRDTISPVVYFQQMGRCFSVGQELQPLLFDFVNNFNIKSSVHSITQNFYNDFEEHNEGNYFKKRNLIIDFYDETLDFQDFINEFSVNYITWDERYKELKKFVATNSRLPFQSETNWLTNQKESFKKGKLTQQQIELLLQIDENIFETKFVIKTWEERFDELKEFIESNGRFPFYSESYWLTKQKESFKKGKLTQQQIELLLQLDENIFESKAVVKSWKERFEEFKEFVESKGRLPLFHENSWYIAQKESFRNRKLSRERIELLLQIDENIFKSKVVVKTWDERFEEFKEFIATNGRLPFQSESYWLTKQKESFKKGKLSQERIELLLQINENIFESKTKTWNERYEEIEKFIEANGRLPFYYETNWLKAQKESFRKGKLTQQQIELLLQIDKNIFTSKIVVKTWKERFEEFKEFIETNGRLPFLKENPWYFDQKINFRKGKLTQQQIELLLQIDKNIFEVKVVFKTWEESYDVLRNFVKDNGRLPKQKEFPWINHQRHYYRNNTLSSEKIQLLKEVDINFFEPKK